MTAPDALLIVVGLTCGFGLGYVTAWRFARKLEHHKVVLAEWDMPYDAQAPRQPAKFGRGA
jgi:hypothetical protein